MPTKTPDAAPPDDIDAWINSGDRPEATVSICLAGRIRAEYDAKSVELLEASRNRKTMSDGKAVRALTDELEAIRVRMEAASRTFRLRALEPHVYQQMVSDHPARDDNELDAQHAVNTETFYPALVEACTVDPPLTSEQWVSVRSKMNARQWDEVWTVAYALNRREVAVPKPLDVSALTPGSDET